MTSTELPYAGAPVRIGGRDFIVPPLSFGYIVKNGAKLRSPDPSATVEEIAQLHIEIAHAALRRNYPDLTIDEVGDMLDPNTSLALFESIKKASGYSSGEANLGTTPPP